MTRARVQLEKAAAAQQTDERQWLLRPRDERPRHGRPADQSDEIAPLCMTRKEHSEGRLGFGHDRQLRPFHAPHMSRSLSLNAGYAAEPGKGQGRRSYPALRRTEVIKFSYCRVA